MKNIYQLLTGFNGDEYKFHDYVIDTLRLKDVFGNVYAVYQKKDEARKAILFIVSVYSIYSDMQEFGQPLSKIKQRAAEKWELDEFMRDELCDFKFAYETKATKRKGSLSGDGDIEAISEDDGIEEIVVGEKSKYSIEKIITSIEAFLKYQDDPIVTNILRKKDHYDQVSTAAHRIHLKDDKGTVDWELKMKLNNQADKLLTEIEEWEKKLRERNNGIQSAVRDVEENKRKVLTTLRVEHAIR